MKSDNQPTLLAKILSSQVRSEIFRLLFDPHSSTSELHMREMERRSQLAIGTLQQDLKKLSEMDLIKSRRDGNRLYYRANSEHPLYHEIKNMVVKTTGVVQIIHNILSSAKLLSSDIEFAFIYGSMARNEEKGHSDLDMMIVGNIGLRKLSHLLSGTTELIGREINPHIITSKDLKNRLLKKDHFLTEVLNSKKIFIIGTEDELKTMGR